MIEKKLNKVFAKKKVKIVESEYGFLYTRLTDGKTMWYVMEPIVKCNRCENVIWYKDDKKQYEKNKLCVDCNREIKRLIKIDPEYRNLSVMDISNSLEIIKELKGE